MKVTRYICDRCGREVLQIQRTAVEIRDIAAGQQIDLCPDCALGLDAWLESGARDAAHRIVDEMIAERDAANKKDGE